MQHLIQRLLQPPILLTTLLLSVVAIGLIGFLNLGNLEPPPVAPSQSSATPPATVVTNPRRPPAAPTTVSKPQDELATPTTQLTQFQWQIGARQTYRYQLQTELKVDMTATLKTDQNTQPQWQQINSQLSGILNLRVFDTQHDRVQLGVQLSNVEYTLNQQTFAPLTALLQTFFLVEMSKEGKPLYFHFPRYIDHSNQVFLKEILDNVQVVLTQTSQDASWQTQETHGSGTYQADYQRQPGNQIHKQKTRYVHVTFQEAMTKSKAELFPITTLTGTINQSAFTVHLTPQHSWLTSLQGQEQVEFNTPSGTLAKVTAKVELKSSDDPQDPNLGIWLASEDFQQVLQYFAEAQGDVSLSEDVIKRLERDKLRQQYANVTLPQLLDQILKGGDSLSQEHAQAVKDYLRAYPEAALEMPTLLDTLNPNREISNHLISLLETVGTPEAQQALATIATHAKVEEATQNRAVQAIIAFNFIEEPQPLVLDTLTQLADSDNGERADTALLAMGSLLQNAGGTLQFEVRDELRRRFQQSPTAEGKAMNKATLLRAVGNSGDASFLPDVTPYLTNEDSDTRAAATEAMRKFNDPTSLTHLLTALTTDAHREVRLSALRSLQDREDNAQALSTLKEYLSKETDPELRMRLIQFLGKHKTEDPTIVEVLKQELPRESERELKKQLYNEIYR